MTACLGNYLERRFGSLPSEVGIRPFLSLLLLVAQSPSLVVSIPALVTWTRVLINPPLGSMAVDAELIGPLLDLCSSRLIRYENLPEGVRDPTYLLLLEDTDTIPERHAFLGNYRRYSSQVIKAVVQLRVLEATYYILGQTENVLRSLFDDQALFRGV